MRRRHVLLLNPAGVTAYCCSGGQVLVEAQFAAGDTTEFDAYLEPRVHEEFAVLVDVPDESFALERLPHVGGRNRQALMRRKRERHCHGSPLCATLPQGRQREGRRDDRVLFAALTRPQTVEPWLQRLALAQAPVSGVYSLPLLVADFITARSGDSYVVATIGRAGLRQTFMADGQLRFSRLTPLTGDAIGEAAAACATEAAHLRRYLCGQRLIERDGPLTVLALLHPDQMDEFRRHCRDSHDVSFDCLDLVAAAARRGCAISQPGSCSDALFAHLLCQTPPRRQFAADEVRLHWRSRRLRRAIDVFGWTALTASVLFAAIQLPAIFRARDTAEALQAQNDAYERTHGRGAGESALSPPRLQMRELGAATAALTRASSGPAPLLRRLGRAMEALPAIELERLDWQIAAEMDHAKGPYAVLDVRGFCALHDPAEQQRNVERLAEGLRRDPSVQANVLKWPATWASTQTIRSADVSKTDAAFILRLVQKL